MPEAADVLVDEASVNSAIAAGIASCQQDFSVPTRLKGNGTDTASSTTNGKSKADKRRGKKAATGDEIVSYSLDNGAQLHVKPRRDIPVVAVRAAFLGGLLAQTPENAGICHFLSSAWLRGTRTRSAADFARAMEDIASEIEGFSGRSSLGLTLDVATNQFEPALDLCCSSCGMISSTSARSWLSSLKK